MLHILYVKILSELGGFGIFLFAILVIMTSA